MSLQCMLSTSSMPYAYAEMLSGILAPMMLALAFAAGVGAWTLCRWSDHALKNAYRRVLIVIICVVFLFQADAVKGTIRLFTCYNVGSESMLYAQMTIHCESEEHRTWQYMVALPAMLLYGLVLPLATLISMRRHLVKAETGTAIDAIDNASNSLQFDELGLRLWGFLTKDCKFQYYWWELSRNWRKLLCAVLIQLGRPAGVELQALLVLIVYIVALAAQARFMPYKQQLINRLELLAIADFIITVWLAMLLTIARDSTQEEVLSMLIIVANVSALLIYFGCIVQQLRKRIPLGTVDEADDAEAATIEMCEVLPNSIMLEQEQEPVKSSPLDASQDTANEASKATGSHQVAIEEGGANATQPTRMAARLGTITALTELSEVEMQTLARDRPALARVLQQKANIAVLQI